jgi:hypothetical protein
MKVSELISLLQNNGINPNDEVILSSDAEGNNYSVLSGYNLCNYTGRALDIQTGLRALDEDLIEFGYTEEDLLPNGLPGVILYPT